MRLPESAPSLESAFAALASPRMAQVMQHVNPLPGGKYLHWDELRRRAAPEGLSHAEWWAGLNHVLTTAPQLTTGNRMRVLIDYVMTRIAAANATNGVPWVALGVG